MILSTDIGGTSVKLGLVDRTGALNAKAEAPVHFDNYQTPMIDTVIRAAGEFLAQHPCALEGVGVSATGQIDSRSGVIVGTNGKIANYELVQQMVAALPCPVIAEGRVHTPEQAKKMLELGAWAVVVGGAITRPLEIAARFMNAVKDVQA